MIVYVTVVEHFFMCSRVATKILKITLCKKNQDSYHADNMVSFDPIEGVLLHDPEYGLLIPPSLAPKPSQHCHLQHKNSPRPSQCSLFAAQNAPRPSQCPLFAAQNSPRPSQCPLFAAQN